MWVSFSLEDSLGVCLRSKELLVDAVHQVLGCGQVDAFLVNCCAPQAITAALPTLVTSSKGGQGTPHQYDRAFVRANAEVCMECRKRKNRVLSKRFSDNYNRMDGV